MSGGELGTSDNEITSAGGVVVAVVGGVEYVALVRRKDGTWVLPKGHLDQGETLIQGAKREIQEETGLEPSELEFERDLGAFAFNEFEPSKHHLKINHFFLFRYREARLPPLRTDDMHMESTWHELPLERVAMCYAYQKQLLSDLFQGR